MEIGHSTQLYMLTSRFPPVLITSLSLVHSLQCQSDPTAQVHLPQKWSQWFMNLKLILLHHPFSHTYTWLLCLLLYSLAHGIRSNVDIFEALLCEQLHSSLDSCCRTSFFLVPISLVPECTTTSGYSPFPVRMSFRHSKTSMTLMLGRQHIKLESLLWPQKHLSILLTIEFPNTITLLFAASIQQHPQ